jgi:uncharacterized ion transporter superfamily protein YfcC
MPRFRVPHTLVLLAGMIALALVATYALPAGSFERVTNEAGREQVVAGSYHRIEAEILAPWAALTAIPRGFAAAGEIIFFVFLIGGAVAVFRATGAPDAGIAALLRRLGHMPGLLLFGGLLVFAVGSSTIGMAEEYLPFVPLLLTLCIGMGYDAVVAVAIVALGFGIGYAAATINPFTVLIAQDIAGLEPGSGMGYRLIIAPVLLGISFHHVWRYAGRVKREPGASLVADQRIAAPGPASGPAPGAEAHGARLTGTHVVILSITGAAFVLIVCGIELWGWGLQEMGALFLGLAIVLAAIARMGADRMAQAFCAGAAELTTTALLIGFARAIIVVLEDGRVVDTVIHGLAAPLAHLGAGAAAVGMFLVQAVCSLVVPSGSGQAYVTMPIMAPLGDLVGVSRQVAVLAFQLGDGLNNVVVPTNALLVGYLAVAGVPFDRWVRFVGPLVLKLWLAAAAILLVAVWTGYQ